MSEWKAKRFWKSVEVVPDGTGYGIRLDGRSVKTPLKRDLIAPSRKLAEEIAKEWDAVEENIDPGSMPFTRSANAAIDKVMDQFDDVVDMLVAYGDSDLVCYRADSPEGLVNRQRHAWDPLILWVAQVYGIKLDTRTGVMHVPQSPNVLSRFDAEVRAFVPFELTAFHDLVSLSGSLVLGLAVAKDHVDPDTAWELSRIDETWQIEQWGEDEEATQLAASKRDSFLHAARFFAIGRADT